MRAALEELIQGILKIEHPRQELTYGAQANNLGKRMRVEKVMAAIMMLGERRPQTFGEMAADGIGKESSADITGDGPTESTTSQMSRPLTGVPVFQLLGLKDVTRLQTE